MRNIKTENVEQLYEQVSEKKAFYVFMVVLFTVLPVFGYVSKGVISGFKALSDDEWQYLFLNVGTYAVLGVVSALIVVLIIATIYIFLKSIFSGGLILAFITATLFYILIAGAGVGILTVGYGWFSDVLSGGMVAKIFDKGIPGVSETLGTAIICSLLYWLPYIMVLLKMVNYRGKCKSLNGMAEEARLARESKEEAERQTQEPRKQQRKEQKDRDRRARETWEGHKKYEDRMKRMDNPDSADFE